MSASPVISAMTPPTPVVQEGNEITVTRAISWNIVVGTDIIEMDQVASAAVHAIGQMSAASGSTTATPEDDHHHEGNPRDNGNSTLKEAFSPAGGPTESNTAARLTAAFVDGNFTLCTHLGDSITNDMAGMAGIHEEFGKIRQTIETQGARHAAERTWSIVAMSCLGGMAIAAYFMRR